MTCLVETDLCLVKAQSKAYNLSFTTGDGTAQDITGAAITFTLKRSLTDPTAKLTKTATITDAPNGKATLTLTTTDTDIDLGTYFYDIWLESVSIAALPVQRGHVTVGWKVKD